MYVGHRRKENHCDRYTFEPGSDRWSRAVEQLNASRALDELFAKIDSGEIELIGDGGLVPVFIKETLERDLRN